MKSPIFSRERLLAALAVLLTPIIGYLFWVVLPPWWTVICSLYLAASCLAFVYYAIDKHAAVYHLERVSELRLHLTELVGGWPGAWLAQRLLRHKTIKKSFRRVFWLIVLGHGALWGYLIYRSFI